MMDKMKSILKKGKKKHAIALVGGALALTLGTGAVFAASPSHAKERLLVKNDNGVKTFSTDNGKTWTNNAPTSFTQTINKDGSETSTVGVPPKNGKELMVQNKNGQIKYSTDGGKTWSDKAPDGVTVSSKNGSLSVKGKIDGNGGERSQVQVKNENGASSYSTDGGKTWKQGIPDGFKEKINADGKGTSVNGDPSPLGKNLQVQNLNGTIKYSTDGGKTWSDKAPDGVTVSKDGSIRVENK